jgi:hypothetical protein
VRFRAGEFESAQQPVHVLYTIRANGRLMEQSDYNGSF